MTIVSSDKDMMQLVGDGVTMLDPIKNRPIGAAEVREKFGVGPDKVIEVQALCGDSVDNVPGVPGIGVKTAAELINTLWRSRDAAGPRRRDQAAEAARDADRACRARRASPRAGQARRTMCRCPPAFADLARREPDPDTLLAFLRENEVPRARRRESRRRLAARPRRQPPGRRRRHRRVLPRSGAADLCAGSDAGGARPLDRGAPRRPASSRSHSRTEGCTSGSRAGARRPRAGARAGRAAYLPLGHRGGGGAGQLDLAAAPPAQLPLDRCARDG